jgi:hypothetical protein
MNCILYTTLQKYYNSLESLNSLNISDDMMENIRNLDNFFSEFRNITFVLQKSFKSNGCFDIYEKNLHILKTPKMNWFVDKRNEVIKEFSIKLEKEIKVFQYVNFSKTQSHNLIFNINSDENFETSLVNLLQEITSERKLDTHITIELIFKENGEKIDIYQRILEGINIMDTFISLIKREICCTCTLCRKINTKIKKQLNDVVIKSFLFCFDYYIPAYNKKDIVPGARYEILVEADKNIIRPKETKYEISKSIYSEHGSNTLRLFELFSFLHCQFYKMQNNSLMTTFLVLFNDETFIHYSFASETKSTVYREINYIANLILSERVKAVLYIGESYFYSTKSFPIDMSYIDRIKKADGEGLMACMICDELCEYSCLFKSDQINDTEIFNIIENKNKKEFTEIGMFLPIYKSFIKRTNFPFSKEGLLKKFPFMSF